MLLLVSAPALAGTTCVDVDAFNAWAAVNGAVDALTVRFDVTGVDPDDFPETKGALFDLVDTSCAGGAGAALKVYGPYDPPNTAHPAGTLKLEVYDACIAGADETWASPNPSDVIFENGAEDCEVLGWVRPDTFGYELVCDGVSYPAEGDNTFGLVVDHVTLFSLADGGTWRLEHAVSTWNEVCYEGAGQQEEDHTGGATSAGELELLEDVTVSAASPDEVYEDPEDLSVGLDDSEVYLKFDLSGITGTVTEATLTLHALPESWAEGDGAELWLAAGASWSEETLTWSARPGGTGELLDRVGPVDSDTSCTWSLDPGVLDGEVLALALLPGDSDDNGVHFHSKESSSELAPRLAVSWIEEEEGGEEEDEEDGGAPEDEDDSGWTSVVREVDDEDAAGCGCAGAAEASWLALLPAIPLARRRRGRVSSPG